MLLAVCGAGFSGERDLAKREAEVARLMIANMDNEAIADKLCVSSRTVSYHINNIYQKFDFDGNHSGRIAFLALFKQK